MRSAALLAALLLAGACRDDAPSARPLEESEAQPTVTFFGAVDEATVLVEVADSPSEQSRGLMYRRELAPERGMIFVFATEVEHSFWMKNTYIPLDMIFVDSASKVVGVVANAEPLTETSRSVGVPSKYVVEVNAGFAAEHGVAAGASVRIDLGDGEQRL